MTVREPLSLAISLLLLSGCGNQQKETKKVLIDNDNQHNSAAIVLPDHADVFDTYFDEETSSTVVCCYGLCFSKADSIWRTSVVMNTSTDLAEWDTKEIEIAYEGQTVLDSLSVGRQTECLGQINIAETGCRVLLIGNGSSVYSLISDGISRPFAHMGKLFQSLDISDKAVSHISFFHDSSDHNYLLYAEKKDQKHSEIFLVPVRIDTERRGLSASDPIKLCEMPFVAERVLMFVLERKYYVCATDPRNSNGLYYASSGSIDRGYRKTRLMRGSGKDGARNTVLSSVLIVGDTLNRLAIYNGRERDAASDLEERHILIPITLDPENDPVFNSLSQWMVNTTSGIWSVGQKNNYVINGSFESCKCEEGQTLRPNGWNVSTSLGKDKAVRVETDSTDKRGGRRHLTISGCGDKEVRIRQAIRPTPNRPLNKGIHSLSLEIKTEGTFESLTIYAKDADKTTEWQLPAGGEKGWRRIQKEISVGYNGVEIAFSAYGSEDSKCMIDNIRLERVGEKHQ